MVAKAASISWLVSALSTWICNPTARAAGSTSLNVVSVFVAMAGLTSTATRAAPGTSSRRSSSRFATNSVETKLIPVRLPPGRARLATRPSLTGSSLTVKTMGIVVVAAFAANATGGAFDRGDHGNPPADQFGRQRRQPIHLILGPAVFDRPGLALDIAALLQGLAKCAQIVRVRVRRCGAEEPDHRHRRLLRTHGERPHGCRAAEQGYKLPPLHSITSSARASSVGGTSRPRTLAVCKLMMSSNLVARRIGRSAGFSPLRMRPV